MTIKISSRFLLWVDFSQDQEIHDLVEGHDLVTQLHMIDFERDLMGDWHIHEIDTIGMHCTIIVSFG